MTIDVFERPEESCEVLLEMRRESAGLVKVAASKLSGDRDRGRTHRAVFLSSLGPGHASFVVEPEREPHLI